MTLCRPASRALLVLLVLLLAGGLGCGGSKPETATTETAGGEAPPPAEPIVVEDLEPALREVTTAGGGLVKIVVELAKPVVEEAKVGGAAGSSELAITPAVDGALRWTSPSTLTFEPTRGFVPGTRYRVELVAVETRDGVLRTPGPGRWSRVVETPPFGLAEVALASVAYVAKEARLSLVFSAAVDPQEVARHTRIDVVSPGRSREARSVRYERGDDPLTVRAILSGDDVAPGHRFEVALRPGLPSAVEPVSVASAHRATVRLERGEEARLLAVYRAESQNGFYIQVVCDDGAVGERRYYWDRTQHSSYEVSTRCQPAEEDVASIAVDPPVELTVSPASGGFRIFGAFERGAYRLRIPAGLRTADGGMVYQGWEGELAIPVRSPQVGFTSQGRYLPRQAWKSLPIHHLNVKEATLAVRHVPPENLVFWMSADYGEEADERNSNLVYEQKLPLQGPTDVETTTFLDLASRIPADTKGLLDVSLQASGAQDRARILLSDLQLVAKRTGVVAGVPESESWKGETVRVWALDAESTEPQRGVDLKLVRKSGYTLATCRTGGDGGCDLAVPEEAMDPGPPFAVIASRGDDLTYLRFADLRTEIQEARVSGDPYRGETRPYRAAVYSDRGVYRPGETVHLAAIVRDKGLEAPPETMPIEARLSDSQGRIVERRTLATNAAGYAHLDVELAAFAETGRHELVLAAAGVPLGSASFQVEEFVPERMRVEAIPAEPQYKLGETIAVEVDARYLFGGVPAGHKVEVECELRPGSFAPEKLASYQFGVFTPEEEPARPIGLGTVAGELDDDGHGALECPPAGEAGGFHGPAQIVARAAVFEAGSGRATVGQATAPVHPESFYLGLQARSKEARAGQPLEVDGVVVDWEGRPVVAAREVSLELLRLDEEWGWYYDPDLGYDRYRRYRRPVVEERTTAQAKDGKLSVRFTPRTDASGFIVRATAGAARTELEVAGGGWSYGWWWDEEDSSRTPRPGRPTWLALSAPASAKVGERFPVRFKVPYRGRVLLTAETDEILRSEWLEVDAGEAVWWLEAEEFVPNVYVSALLIKDPHLDAAAAYLPDRAFGVQSVRLEPEAYTYPLKLTVPAEVRSRSKLAVELDLGKTEGPTYATVAAVDQGILSLTRFPSPDPGATIFARRALGIETFETIGWSLMVPPSTPSSVVGGDEGGLPGRIDSVKPVALWSGLVEVPASGKTRVELELPQYRGELRVMAVAAGPKKLGRAEARVVVRDPVVVEATLPRFLSQGDEIEIPVFVSNLSGKKLAVAVALEVADLPIGGALVGQEPAAPVEILGPAATSLDLGDGANGTAVFRAKAIRPTGAATFTVKASAGGYEALEAEDVPLLPVGPKSRVVQRIELQTGDNDLVPYLAGWQPLSERSSLLVSSNPYGDAFGHLSWLVRYPYGCIEQTTSALRPLLYLGRLLDVFDPELAERGSVDDMIKSGIDRLLSMQTPSGGFGYWPGDREPFTWGTANAVQLLVDARDLDHPVPADRLEDALGWLEREIANVYESGRLSDYHQGAEAYAHYVLARAGRARKARVETLLQGLSGQSTGRAREDRYLLQAALFQAGDRRYESELRHPDLSPVSDERWDGWSFYSDRRRRGLMLSVFTDLFGHHADGEPLADLVADSLRGQPSWWFTTQELVWGVAGLGKFVGAGAGSFDPPVLSAGKRVVPPLARAKDTGAERAWSLARASEIEHLSLAVPKKGEGKLYLILSSEGVRREADWRTGGEGLAVSRSYLDAEGGLLDLETPLPLGAVVYVELGISNKSGERVSNVALVDRVPAGFEIENPRLGRDGAESVGWISADELWEPSHMNLRDDRLEVFGHLSRGESKTVVYAVRATTAGRFTVPPIEAEAMYNPRLWAREAGERVEIVRR